MMCLCALPLSGELRSIPCSIITLVSIYNHPSITLINTILSLIHPPPPEIATDGSIFSHVGSKLFSEEDISVLAYEEAWPLKMLEFSCRAQLAYQVGGSGL